LARADGAASATLRLLTAVNPRFIFLRRTFGYWSLKLRIELDDLQDVISFNEGEYLTDLEAKPRTYIQRDRFADVLLF
jgi:hypothetical protein